MACTFRHEPGLRIDLFVAHLYADMPGWRVRRRAWGLFALAVTLGLVLVAGTRPAAAGGPASHVELLQNVRMGLLTGDAPLLARQFPPADRVYVALPPFERGAFLGPGPLRSLLSRLVRAVETVTLEYESPPGAVGADSRVIFVKARWVYRERASRVRRETDLHLALARAPHQDTWSVVEVRIPR